MPETIARLSAVAALFVMSCATGPDRESEPAAAPSGGAEAVEAESDGSADASSDSSGDTGTDAERKDPCHAVSAGESIELDLDGDGAGDAVSREPSGAGDVDPRWLDVVLDDGSRVRLGADDGAEVTLRDMDGSDESAYTGDFSCVADWGVRENKNGKIVGSVGPLGGGGYEISGALGEGLYISGTDASIVVYLTDDGWAVSRLGF